MQSARDITLGLNGVFRGNYGKAPCPVCQTGKKTQDALTIGDGYFGNLVLHCKKSGCQFLDILSAIGLSRDSYEPPSASEVARRKAEDEAQAIKRSKQSESIWKEAVQIAGTPAEAYLRSRGITCELPKSLRYHPECWHGATAKRLPAMVAAIQGKKLPAIHRTYLKPDGSAKADVNPSKAMLGSVLGGAVRLSQGHEALVVCEGIETGLSLASGLLSGSTEVWAGLSTSGIKGLVLPALEGRRLIVAADGDTAGKQSAEELAERAARLGWMVERATAPDNQDFNDVLIAETADRNNSNEYDKT